MQDYNRKMCLELARTFFELPDGKMFTWQQLVDVMKKCAKGNQSFNPLILLYCILRTRKIFKRQWHENFSWLPEIIKHLAQKRLFLFYP
jgi:hypothetical protein